MYAIRSYYDLGWAARDLGEMVQRMIESEFSPEAMKEWLRKIYNSERFGEYLDSLTDRNNFV